jgi:outer membrane receptor for ferrienterochelin and colicins
LPEPGPTPDPIVSKKPAILPKPRSRRHASLRHPATRLLELAAASTLALAAPARAADGAAPAPSAAASAVQQVEVRGDAAGLDRRTSSAAKIVVSHEDLARYGDTSIAQALQRVSGVSVVRSGNRGLEIRLRGLGNGYTQILVDGQPVPAGFSIESLDPALVDHIDVLRSATADTSAQGIAGSVNIVLRRPAAAPSTLKLALAEKQGRPSANGRFDGGGQRGDLSWRLGASVALARDFQPASALTTGQSAGAPAYAYATDNDSREKLTTSALTPQLSWKLAGGGALDLSALLQDRRGVYLETNTRRALAGDGFDFASDRMRTADDARLGRATLAWTSAQDGDVRGEARLVASTNTRHIDAVYAGDDADGTRRLDRLVHSSMRDNALLATGKAARALGDDHALAIGWDGQAGHRGEHRVQDDSSAVGYPTLDLDEDYAADIARLAFFAQDEWQASTATSVYAGVRWEGLHTRVTGTDLAATGARSSVWSPTLQTLWKVPGTRTDQLRLSVGHTYKAPTARDIVPRLWVVPENGPTDPDYRGNPDLRPELAWGADLGYERWLADGALLAINAYTRRIHDVVVHQVRLEDDGLWVESPVNASRATVSGLELEAKGPLRRLPGAGGLPDVDLRLGGTRNWSHVDGVGSPGARLSQQRPYTLTLGADWHLSAAPVTAGASFVYERGGMARSSTSRYDVLADKRQLDAYVLWKQDKQTQWRATVTDALALHSASSSTYADETQGETGRRVEPGAAAVRVQYETGF